MVLGFIFSSPGFAQRNIKMDTQMGMLSAEALTVLFLIFFIHSLRRKYGLLPYYGLIGGLTVLMSWITDAGLSIQFHGITFMIGSTAFYTSLLVAVFLAYVFNGPGAARISIAIIAALSIITPVTSFVLHSQMGSSDVTMALAIPLPDLRINTASVLTTILDMIFLGVMWEFLGRKLFRLPLWTRTLITFMGVMLLDVLIFNTGAFAGSSNYFTIMKGTLISRLLITAFVFPLLYIYIHIQNKRSPDEMENRPLLAILTQVAAIRKELDLANGEIVRRQRVEKENALLIENLRLTLARVQKLEGLLPVCSVCGKIRDGESGSGENWIALEKYIRENTQVKLSHGVCPDCMEKNYPEVNGKPASE